MHLIGGEPTHIYCRYLKAYLFLAGFDANVPYTVAMVKLNEDRMITSQLNDLGGTSVEIGMPPEMVTRKMRNDGDERGVILYGHKF